MNRGLGLLVVTTGSSAFETLNGSAQQQAPADMKNADLNYGDW
ncbi:hypothetical protein [Acinetobacter baumannii]